MLKFRTWLHDQSILDYEKEVDPKNKRTIIPEQVTGHLLIISWKQIVLWNVSKGRLFYCEGLIILRQRVDDSTEW